MPLVLAIDPEGSAALDEYGLAMVDLITLCADEDDDEQEDEDNGDDEEKSLRALAMGASRAVAWT